MMDQIQKIKCPICLDNATEIPMATEDFDYFECQRCGKFYLCGSLVSEFSHKEVPLSLISSWIRNQNERGKTPKLTTYVFKELKTSLTVPSVSKKQLLLM